MSDQAACRAPTVVALPAKIDFSLMVPPGGPVRRVVDLLSLQRVLRIYPSLEMALVAAG
jgi:hypothetical protein